MALQNLSYESERIDAIADAVDAMNGKELSRVQGDGLESYTTGDWFEYEVVEREALDGGTDHSHEIDASSVPDGHTTNLMAHLQAELAERGFIINTVDFEQERFHVMHGSWFTRRTPEDMEDFSIEQ